MEIHVQFVLSLQPEVNLQNQKWEVWNNKKKPNKNRNETLDFHLYLPHSASLAFVYTTEAGQMTVYTAKT